MDAELRTTKLRRPGPSDPSHPRAYPVPVRLANRPTLGRPQWSSPPVAFSAHLPGEIGRSEPGKKGRPALSGADRCAGRASGLRGGYELRLDNFTDGYSCENALSAFAEPAPCVVFGSPAVSAWQSSCPWGKQPIRSWLCRYPSSICRRSGGAPRVWRRPARAAP